MIGIIYKFEIMSQVRFNGYKPFYGRHHTEETIKKIKAKRKLQVITEEIKRKMKESRKDFVWITNGEKETLVNKNSTLPDGWHRGRLKFKK